MLRGLSGYQLAEWIAFCKIKNEKPVEQVGDDVIAAKSNAYFGAEVK